MRMRLNSERETKAMEGVRMLFGSDSTNVMNDIKETYVNINIVLANGSLYGSISGPINNSQISLAARNIPTLKEVVKSRAEIKHEPGKVRKSK